MKKNLLIATLILFLLTVFTACTNSETNLDSGVDVGFNRVGLEEMSEDNVERIKERKNSSGHTILTQDQKQYIVVFAGEKPSSGYEIRIERIKERGGQLEVYVSESKPDPDSMQLTVLTYPLDIVKIEGFEDLKNVDVIGQ